MATEQPSLIVETDSPFVNVFCDSTARTHETQGKVADEFNRPYARRYMILEALLSEKHVTIEPGEEIVTSIPVQNASKARHPQDAIEDTHQDSSTDEDDTTEEFTVGGAMVDFDFPICTKRRRVDKAESKSDSRVTVGYGSCCYVVIIQRRMPHVFYASCIAQMHRLQMQHSTMQKVLL
eukprot:m.318881 g.318881  ORF g.318881 m.318881 type:complete len:179 (-) comp20292_c0_seq2:1662-2198(-)